MVNIDERVMSMKFDNSQFRRAAAETIGDLGRLRKSVKMDGVTSGLTKLSDPVKDLDKTIKSSKIKGGFKGISTAATQSFSEIESSASGVKLDGITAGVENAKRSFISLGDIASVALGGLAAKGIDKALGGLKGLYDNTLGQIKTGGMSRARNLEQANFMLGGIMDTEEQVKQVMDAANASVTGTAYGLDQAAKAAAQFAASNVPIENLETSLTGIVGVAAMTSSEFDDIARIFTTVAGNGRVFATELNSIGARGINAAAALAEHFGVTEEKVREMVSAGEVNFEQFSTAMATAFGPQAAKANDTYSGSLSNLRSALSRIGADTAAVKLEGMRDVFNALRPIINGVHNALKPFINTLNNNLRAAFAGVVGPLTKAGDAFTAFFDPKQGASAAGAFAPVIKFIQDIGQVAGLVSEVLKDMVAVIFGASPRFIEMSETTTKAGTTIQHIFRKLLSVIMLVPEIIGMIIKAFRGTEDSAGSAGLSILELVDKVSGFLYITAEVIRKSKALNFIVGVIGGLFRIAAGGVAVFLKAISLVVDGIVKLRNPLDVLKDIVEYAKNHFAGIFDSLRTESLDKFIDFVVSGFRKIKKAIRNFSFGSLLKDFKIPRVSFKAFESVSKIFDNVRKSISRVVKSLKEIDWSPITSMFSGGFTMPSFGDVKAIGTGIRSSVMGGINNLSWDYVLEFATAVRDSFTNLIEYLRGIDWSGIWVRISSSFTTGVRNVVGAMSNFKDLVIKAGKSVAEGLKSFGSWAVEALGNVDWAEVGSAIGNGIIKAVAFVVGSAAAITGAIANFFKSAIDAIDWGSVLEGLSKMVENIEGVFKEIGKAFRGETIDTSYLENALGKSTADVAISVSQDLGAKTKSLQEGIRDFFGVLFGTGPDAPAEASELMKGTKDFGDNVKTISASLKSPFGTAKKSVMSEITGFGSTVQKAAESLLEGVNIVEILNGIGIAFTGAGIFKLVGVLEQFAAVPKSLAGALDSIGTSIKSMGEAAKIEAQGNSYLKLAIAFGILAGSVWVLSQVPWDQLNVGLAVVLTLIVTLVGSAILLDKMLSEDAAAKLNELGNAFLKIGLSIGIMAASVWLLGQMDPETIIQGLFTAILSIAALAGGVALAGLTKGLNGMGFAFMGLAAGVAILAGAFLLFKMISYEDIEKGLVTMGAAVLAISLAARIADGKKLAGAGMAMIGVGAGLYALAFSFKAIADLDDRQLLIGLGVLTAVLIGIAAVTHFGGKNLVTTAGTLVGISFALMALAYAMSLIAAIPFWDLVGGMAVLIGGLAGLGWALKKFPPTLPAIAGSLAGIAGALAILVVAIYILGSMDLGVLVQGALAIGFLTLAIGGLAFAVSKMPPNSLANIFGLTVAFMALAGSVLVMAHAMRMFQDIEWESLGKAGAVVAGAVAAFAVLAAIGTYLGAGLAIFGGGLAAVGGGLLVIAGAVWVFADAVGKIADSMKTLSEIGDSIKDALKNAGTGITLFAEEAEEGLRKLFGVIGFTGGGKVKSLAKLFESFGEIPSDIGNRLAGLKKGLSELQEVIPTIESLAEIGGPNGNGNAKFLNQFFKAFSEIEPNVGEGITSLVDGIRDLSGIHDELAILKTFMDDLAGGDRTVFNNSQSIKDLKHFFEAFDDIDPNVGKGVRSLSSGIAALGGVKDDLDKVKAFADGFWGDEEERTVFNNSRSIKDLKHFFEAFDDIDPNVGESVSNLADGIGALGGIHNELATLKTFMDDLAGGDRTVFNNSRSIKDLKHFFEAFEDIDSNVGESVSNLADGIGALGGVKDQLNTLKTFADGFWGDEEERTVFNNSRSIKDLKHFFEAFEDIDVNVGESVTNLSSGIAALGGVKDDLDKVKAFADGFWGDEEERTVFNNSRSIKDLKHFFEAFDDIDPNVGESVTNLSNGIAALGGVKDDLDKVKAFADGFWGDEEERTFLLKSQSITDLVQFFEAFSVIPPDIGSNVSSLADGISALGKVSKAMETLKGFGDSHDDQGFWDNLLGRFDSTDYLTDFFDAFRDIPTDLGPTLSSLAEGIKALDGVKTNMSNLASFEIGEVGDFTQVFKDLNQDIDSDLGEKLVNVSSGIRQLAQAMPKLIDINSAMNDFDTSALGTALTEFGDALKSGALEGISEAADAISSAADEISSAADAISSAVDSMLAAVTDRTSDFETAGRELTSAMSEGIGEALKSGGLEGISEAADAISSAVDSMLAAVTDRTSDFETAGRELTSAIAEGISNTREMVETTAEEVANAAAEATLIARDAMYDSGLYIIAGLAAGIRDGSEDAVTAARETADAVAAISREALDINSPSRVFMEIGEFVGQGLAIGIDSRQNEVIQAGYNIALAGIKGFEEANPDVVNAGTTFVNSLVKGMENSPFNQRLRQLSTHAKAAHATAVKERKIEDQEEQERAEEERKNIYKEVEEAQKALAEAKEDLSNSEADVKESKAKAKQGEEDKKQTAAQATKAARDAQREKDKITDAEERYQKALREREKYEYRMHGEEAGVAFVDGVAVGLMDDKEAIPSVAEILAQLLLEEVDTLKSKVGNYADVFDGLATISNTSKNMSDNVRDFTRALKRLNNATSSRSIQRNMGMLFDSVVGFMGGIQDLIGVLNIFEPFLPSLLQSFEHSLPAIAGMVAPFAPELAATLGGGLAAAVPAILGPAGGIIAAVAGIGIFLWDQANNKTILKAFKSIFAGVGGFLSKLPEMIVGGLMTLLKGVKETLNDLPGLVDFILTTFIDTVSALLEGIPEMIPLLIEGIIDAILWVLVNAPGILLEVGVALINGMAKAIDAAIKGLANVILMPFRWLTGEIGGTLDLVEVMSSAVDRMAKASGNIIRAALNLILTPFASIYNAIGSVFGLEQIGRDAVIGFAEAIVGAMRKAIDFIAFPFIGLWNFIAGLFGWRQLAGDAASEFIFGTKKALDDGASEVASAAERMAKLMDRHIKGSTRDTLADVKALIDEQVALIKAGATDGVLLGGEAAREASNRVWSNIEDVFDMYGLGKGELEALKNAFYQGTTNPETMVSSFNNVFDHIQRILTLNKVGEGAVDSLNQSMIDSIKQGMMDESMGEFNNRGYQTGTEYVQGMISSLGATKSEIKAASQMVWDDIETVFDFYGLGDEGLEDLKRSYMSGTQNPETYAQTFEKVFSEIERKLLLADIGTESVEALRTSMVESVDYVLQPSVRDSFGGVNREIENALSSEGGQRIGEGIVQGIFSGIKNAIGSLWDFLTSPFVNLYETIRSILSDGYSIASSLVHGIVDGFWSFGNTFSNVGRDIIQGITSGVSSKAGQLFDNLVSTVTDPIGAIKRLLNIHSPSRVMMEIGRNIGDGLTIGIERSTDGVADSMEAAGGDILSAARRMLLEVNDLLEDEVDPVITPILDLSLLKDGVDNMMGMMPNEGLNLETAMLNTTNIASLLSGVAGEAREANNITNIEFHQTNTSPEPLSEYQIYRNTERALDQVVLRNR